MKPLPPDKPIPETGRTLGDFWSWAYSDVISNANRGVLAEYLVGVALDAVGEVRVEWDAYDLVYGGHKIEVKASGYVQTWPQEKPSVISFDIKPKAGWDARANSYSTIPIRIADVYVFCLHAEQDRERANPLDVTQWEFYVLSRRYLDERLGMQGRISLNPLRGHAKPVGYADLRAAVDAVIGGMA